MRALPVGDEKIRSILRLLIRLNFSEFEYDPIWGGCDFHSFISRNASALGFSDDVGNTVSYGLAEAIRGEYSDSPDELIPLGDHKNGPLGSLRLEGFKLVRDLTDRCLTENYYHLSKRFGEMINGIRDCIGTTITENSRFYRARIGYKDKKPGPEFAYGQSPIPLYIGYFGEDIGPPAVSIACEGRLNRAKVSVLYAASESHTAVCEVRPHPGQYVSIGAFSSRRDLFSADFTLSRVSPFLAPGGVEKLKIVAALSDFLTAPVPPDQRTLYLITQTLGDAVREAGFDAIEYLSSVSEGTNVVLFNSADYHFIADSEKVERIDRVLYSSTPMHRFTLENEMCFHKES